METFVAIVVLVVLAIPVGTVYALYRVSRLASEVRSLRRELEGLETEQRWARERAADVHRSGRAATRRGEPDEGAPDEGARDEGAPAAPVGSKSPPRTRGAPAGPSPAVPVTRAPVGTDPVAPTGEASPESESAARARAPRGDRHPVRRRAAALEDARSESEAAPPGEREREGERETEEPNAPPAGRVAGDPSGARAGAYAAPDSPAATSARGDLDLETMIGRTWLLRIGLGVLAIALALFARTIAPALPPAAKVALAYAGSMAFFAAGKLFESRLERFARPVMAAGLSFGFFVAFAAHFVPAMRAVSMPISLAWMAGSMLAILIAAERWHSETTAILAIVLGHVSAQVTAGDADTYSLVMIAALAITAIVLLLRHRWVTVGIVGVAASYGAHLLWLLVEREPPPGNQGFWLSLAFLTSYYVIFLVADLSWWHARAEADEDARPAPAAAPGGSGPPRDDVTYARALGPANLIFYTSLTTFVFFASGASIESIEWYYLTVGTLQGALAWFYRGVHHRDFVYYPVFGTVLWTLGMFAALDALVLNLVLASQALILLVAAHRTGLRVFYVLAQAAMVVALVHYLTYPPPTVVTLPLLLGGVGVAAVYFAKASLEEGWFGEHALLPSLHGIAGSLVLAREAFAYFGAFGGLALFFACALPLLVVVAVGAARMSLIAAATTLAALAPAVVRSSLMDVAVPGGAAAEAAGVVVAGPSFGMAGLRLTLPAWVLVVSVLASALAMLRAGPRRFHDRPNGSIVGQAQAIAIFGIVASYVAVVSLLPLAGELATYLLWMGIPLLVLVYQCVAEGEAGRFHRPGASPARRGPEAPEARTGMAPGKGGTDGDGDEAATARAARQWGVSLVVGAAAGGLALALTGVMIRGALPLALWTSGWSLAAVTGTAAVGAASVLAAAYTVLVAGYAVFLLLTEGMFAGLAMQPVTHAGLTSPGAGLAVVVVGVVGAVVLDRRLHEEPGFEGREPGAALGLGVAPHLISLLLVGLYAGAHLGAGWSFVAAAVLAVTLAYGADRLRAPGALSAALLGVALWHVVLLVAGPRSAATAGALVPLLLFVALTFVLERVGDARLALGPDSELRQPVSITLVLMATLSGMVSMYHSGTVGPTWATVGWSVLGGALMGVGFALRSSLHRRVALAVLGVCVVRVFAVDTVGLSDTARIGAFFMLGIVLVAIAALYTRYGEEMRRWL